MLTNELELSTKYLIRIHKITNGDNNNNMLTLPQPPHHINNSANWFTLKATRIDHYL
nr:8703_t:CDS:2 [Entrophospora candida]